MIKIWREFIVEIALVSISLFLIFIDKLSFIDISFIFKFINNKWMNEINNNGINSSDLITFLTIIIGIYLSILCIISTSQSTVIKALIEANKEESLGIIVLGGIAENLILILYILFSVEFYYRNFILLSLILISVISFIKFICILYYFYKISNKETIKTIEQEEKDKRELFISLAILRDNTKK